MEDLTGRLMSNLVPSSMGAGNTTADDRKWSMSAPGSAGIIPVPDRMDNLPLPEFTNSTQFPVVHPGEQQHVPVSHGNDGGGNFQAITIGGEWKEV
jgi:hypothetical protein